MGDEPLTGGNPEYDTAMVHKMTLFKLKIVFIVNHCYLMDPFFSAHPDNDVTNSPTSWHYPTVCKKDIAMWKMQHALQKRMDPMYFQYAKMKRIFKK